LIVGEYTVFTIGIPSRKSRIHTFWAQNTQVDCWRIHSFSYTKSLKEIKNTQFFGWRIHKLIVGEYTVFHYRKSLKEIENTQFSGGEYTS
jgi:hypothetical protein